jgi:hypothetical protein
LLRGGFSGRPSQSWDNFPSRFPLAPFRTKGNKETPMLDVILRRFDQPDETRSFAKGKFELVRIGGMTIGRARYEPGWKWSVDVGASCGHKYCMVEHVGLVVSGKAVAAMQDGRIIEMNAGDLFYIAPGHDSWVVGSDPYVSLHFMGAGDYAKHEQLESSRNADDKAQ